MKKLGASSFPHQSSPDAKERRTNKELLSIKSKPTCRSMTRYFISRLRNNFADVCMNNRVIVFVNTRLQPGVESKSKHEPFRRLVCQARTVETVSLSLCRSTGLKPSVNENSSCIF